MTDLTRHSSERREGISVAIKRQWPGVAALSVPDMKTSKTGHVTITVVRADGQRFKTLAKNVVVENQASYRIGLENGGRDNGAPADCGRGAYGAYLIDMDGNNIEAIYRER